MVSFSILVMKPLIVCVNECNAIQLINLFFVYTGGQAESVVQNSSVESAAGRDVGNEQKNNMTVNSVNRFGELGKSIPGCIPESEGQKVYILMQYGDPISVFSVFIIGIFC